jgi:putative ABC transport system ATP-binding protein
MAASRVEVKDVGRKFTLAGRDVWAVHEVSLAIEPGECVALVGRSGSGKTTLLNLIAGLDRPTDGEVWIDEQRIDTLPDRQLDRFHRHHVGVVFQSFGLLPLLSARENVELPMRIAGRGHGERVKRAHELLEMVGLGRRAEHRPYELSGGEQQRVAIARALANGPSLVLADEPTGELDSSSAVTIFTLMRDLARQEGATLVACTHDPLVMQLVGRVEELHDGRLAAPEERHVWQHVQAREISPFARPGAPNGKMAERHPTPALSSIVGSDTSRFGRTDSAFVAPSDSEVEHEAEDVTRWRRPERD